MSMRRQVLVQLPDDLLAVVDECASKRGVSRSELVRTALREHLAAMFGAETDRRIVEAYTRQPQPEQDPWAEAAARRSIRDERW
jgi:metal-responsive CopG/Arc/MetJ family transcriptional regulator